VPTLAGWRMVFSGDTIYIFVNNRGTGRASIRNASSDRYLRSDC
jgi:hypothetical protein